MARGSPERLQRDLTTLFRSGALAGLTDRELIHRISRASGDEAEAAFEILVTRHGPMVLRVCRNVLHDPHDAEDAFQATFLVLAKQIRSIRKLDSVGSWLYGVAARVSARARVEAAKRRKHERERVTLAVVSTIENDEASQSLHVQEEVIRLPERYRSVIVLCYWEGLTQEQAARHLGCPIGTVRSRMARARELLRQRLARRGVAPTVIEAGSALAVPRLAPALLRNTVQAASKAAAGQALSKVVAAHVAGLSSHVVRSMVMAKIQSLCVPALLILVASIGLTYGAQAVQSQRGESESEPNPKATASGDAPESSRTHPRPTYREYVVEPPDMLLVEVLEALPGRPISGEHLVRPDGKISLGFYGDVYVAGMTLPEIKEKVVRHLQKYLEDEALGLVAEDPETGELSKPVAPKDSDRVFIDVTAYNSQNYYVLGAFEQPGRLPATGRETVLDVVYFAGGLTPGADHKHLTLVREGSQGAPSKKLSVDFDQIVSGDDTSTNYYMQPGDRLIATLDPTKQDAESEHGSASNRQPPPRAATPQNTGPYFDRRQGEPSRSSRSLEQRLTTIEEQLNKILKKLDDR